MTYSVRCRHFACRHRRVIKKHPDEYKVVPKCPKCGNRKGWRIEGREYNKRDLCNCAGPRIEQSPNGGPPSYGGSFPHKKTHPMCDCHPEGRYNQMKRDGVADEDIPPEHLPERFKNAIAPPF